MSESSYTKLAAVNVNDKLEKKNGLSYLSWAWAVDQLMRADPDADWEYPEPKMFGETMMVYCTVTAFGKKRKAHLPVMDYKNRPIPHPNAFEVNTAMQRCLVKAIALHGLGLYVYAGEDLPPDENGQHQERKDAPKIEKGPSITPTTGYWESIPTNMQNQMLDTAHRVSTLLKRKDVKGAVAELDESCKAFEGREDYMAAQWTCFESHERRALKDGGFHFQTKEKAAA